MSYNMDIQACGSDQVGTYMQVRLRRNRFREVYFPDGADLRFPHSGSPGYLSTNTEGTGLV